MVDSYKKLKSKINSYINYWTKKGMPKELIPDWGKELKSGISDERLQEIAQSYEAFKKEPNIKEGNIILKPSQVRLFEQKQALANLALMSAEIDLNARVPERERAPFPILSERSERFTKDLSVFKDYDDFSSYVKRLDRIRTDYASKWTNPQARENLQKAILGTDTQGGDYSMPESKAQILADFLNDSVFDDEILSALFFNQHWNFDFIYGFDEGEKKAQELYNDLMDEGETNESFKTAWQKGGFAERWAEANEIKGL